ncbi:hypothetical protein AJ80_01464 [Polytolypa hystricis UAMH7299]|uniref:Glutathione S-transferase n=1 Tax=Polytolypa hystricis (strain UAMH7299) TaxID=1447883 RepID=A0A2B7Z1D1_POLH7|nr:hypothetical protein AJ80_01464 [Polytolypa hystricis UAMH7299]
MAAEMKPIKIWGTPATNPVKVIIILKELNIPYELVTVPFPDVKNPEYLAINPNGRLPAIYDPNTDLTLWESGAIVEYLVERYDTQHRLSFPTGTPESYLTKQWMYFQTTGQGPYYGQLAWFKKFHHEQLPSAIERFSNEVVRVTGVLESHLAGQKEKYAAHGSDSDGPWLVGNKLSYADIAFVPWQILGMHFLDKEKYDEAKFPNVKAWFDQMTSRELVKTVLRENGF